MRAQARQIAAKREGLHRVELLELQTMDASARHIVGLRQYGTVLATLFDAKPNRAADAED